MSKLSTREKILIVSLLFTALVVGGFFFVIKPVIDDRAENKQMLAEVEAEKKILISQLDMLSTIEKNLEETRKRVQEEEPKYYAGDIYTWQIDKHIVSLMEKHELEVVSLSVTEPSTYFITNVVKDENGNVQEQSSTPTEAKVATANLSFEGSVEKIVSFVDAIKKMDRQIVVRAWSFQDDRESVKGNFTIEIYCK